MSTGPVRTPCIGTCSTVFGDVVCRGCRRFLHEVRDWNGYDEDARRAVWARLAQFADQVLGSRVLVVDEPRLRELAGRVGVRAGPGDSPALLALGVLRQAARHVRRLEDLGLTALDPGADPRVLLAEVERDLQTLSEAHYERYFAPHVRF